MQVKFKICSAEHGWISKLNLSLSLSVCGCKIYPRPSVGNFGTKSGVVYGTFCASPVNYLSSIALRMLLTIKTCFI